MFSNRLEDLQKEYKLDYELGSGTYGKVERWVRIQTIGNDTHRNVSIALKRFEDIDNGKQISYDAIREIAMLQLLKNHDNVISILGVVSADEEPCLPRMIMQDMAYTLSPIVKLENQFKHAKRIYLMIAKGLKYIHDNGFIHRDLKPDNILCSDIHNLDDCVVKIADFGLAIPFLTGRSNTLIVQTLWWRAPEVLLQLSDYDYAIDVWSLGLIFMQIITPKQNGNSFTAKYSMSRDTQDDITISDIIPRVQRKWKGITTQALEDTKGNFHKLVDLIEKQVGNPEAAKRKLIQIIGSIQEEERLAKWFILRGTPTDEYWYNVEELVRWQKVERIKGIFASDDINHYLRHLNPIDSKWASFVVESTLSLNPSDRRLWLSDVTPDIEPVWGLPPLVPPPLVPQALDMSSSSQSNQRFLPYHRSFDVIAAYNASTNLNLEFRSSLCEWLLSELVDMRNLVNWHDQIEVTHTRLFQATVSIFDRYVQKKPELKEAECRKTITACLSIASCIYIDNRMLDIHDLDEIDTLVCNICHCLNFEVLVPLIIDCFQGYSYGDSNGNQINYNSSLLLCTNFAYIYWGKHNSTDAYEAAKYSLEQYNQSNEHCIAGIGTRKFNDNFTMKNTNIPISIRNDISVYKNGVQVSTPYESGAQSSTENSNSAKRMRLWRAEECILSLSS